MIWNAQRNHIVPNCLKRDVMDRGKEYSLLDFGRSWLKLADFGFISDFNILIFDIKYLNIQMSLNLVYHKIFINKLWLFIYFLSFIYFWFLHHYSIENSNFSNILKKLLQKRSVPVKSHAFLKENSDDSSHHQPERLPVFFPKKFRHTIPKKWPSFSQLNLLLF